jgi:hypothetical protein
MTERKINGADEQSTRYRQVAFQGWLSLAFWISFGLLLESLMAYKAPIYLDDQQRRELFRLAHAHGSVLGMVLIIAAMWARGIGARVSRLAVIALRLGAVVMPLGFLAAGLWHPESEPGLAIWLVPAGALPLIFSLTSIALSSRTK